MIATVSRVSSTWVLSLDRLRCSGKESGHCMLRIVFEPF